MGSRSITCTRLARTKQAGGFANFSNGNWGLIRHTNDSNPFTSLSYGGTESYTYTYDDTNGQGENVDIIFITTKMIYTDNAGYKTSGVSRIQQYQWKNLTSSPTSVTVDYSTSAARSDHSEAVVACACHNTYGAATKANIYIIPRDQITSSSHYWVLPKLFHQQKGNSNPTIVINSFGSRITVAQVKKIAFRGDDYRTLNGGKPMETGFFGGLEPTGFFSNAEVRVPQTADDALIKEMTDAGVIHFMSAGNSRNKLDVSGGVDYNNSYLRWSNGVSYFTNRPAFTNEGSIMVGNLNSWFNDGNTTISDSGDMKEVCPLNGEFIYSKSNRGPRVDCYVAGTAIPIVIPSTSDHTATTNYFANGTSFSCPTLGGLGALVASKYPTTTPAQMRKYFREIAVSSASMGDKIVQPKVSDGDFGDPRYMDPSVSQNSNLKITYVDPALSYDTSSISDTTITYTTETLQPLPTPDDPLQIDYNTRMKSYSGTGGLKELIQALAGVSSFTTDEETKIISFVNRRAAEAYNYSPSWSRYLIVSEERTLTSGNIIPHSQDNKNDIVEFIRIHRTQAFQKNSALEYDFYVDANGANILNITNDNDTSAFVTYKKGISTITADSTDIPSEFFYFIAHASYADFLRMDGQHGKALTEEQLAQNYLDIELEKIDIKNNNNTINKKFSTYVSRQSR